MFDEAVAKANVKTKHDRFESSIIEVDKDDFETFLEEMLQI